MTAYHTALKAGRVEEAPPLDRADFQDGIALCHNIWQPIPAEYSQCDIVYAEPPWRHGYDVFNERAGTNDPPWPDFMRRIATIIRESKCPVVITSGKAALPYLDQPDNCYETQLNGADALLICYGVTLERYETSEFALNEICARFDCIGDWCCGYGLTAVMARRYGKRFVVSDHNATCVGYMATAMA